MSNRYDSAMKCILATTLKISSILFGSRVFVIAKIVFKSITVEVDKIICIILSIEGLQVPYIHQVLS